MRTRIDQSRADEHADRGDPRRRGAGGLPFDRLSTLAVVVLFGPAARAHPAGARRRVAARQMMSPGAIRLTVGAVVAAIVAMSAGGLYFIATTPRSELPVGYRLEEVAAYTLIQLSFGSVGAFLAVRRSRNPIGWLFLLTAAISAWLELSSGYALNAIVRGRSEGALVAWIYNVSTVGLTAAIIPAVVLFPDGRPSTRAGRIVLWLTPTNLLAVAFTGLLPGPLVNMPSVQNPYALRGDGPLVVLMNILFVAVFGGMAGLFVRDLVVRVRAATGVVAQQMKWLVWSALLMVVSVIAAGTLAILLAASPSGGLVTYLARIAFAVVVSTLPVALGLAIVRYHLYDIDLLINRTLVYGALTAALALAYFAAVAVLQTGLLPLTGGSELAVAGSTLAVAALFTPLRRRIQGAVDRRFYRSRYDAARTLDAFSAALSHEVDLDAVRADLIDAVAQTVQPAHASLWLSAERGRR